MKNELMESLEKAVREHMKLPEGTEVTRHRQVLTLRIPPYVPGGPQYFEIKLTEKLY